MLPKQHRLPATVRLQKPCSFSTNTFFLKTGDNNLGVSRFSFIVKKTTDKRATARNRIRRVFRSCIEQDLINIVSGKDFLFFPQAHHTSKQARRAV